MQELFYRITPHDPHAHLFRIQLLISAPDPAGQRLWLPAWIPGSYMIRDFARNIVTLTARCGDQALAVSRIDKSTWQLSPCEGAVEVEYEVYAWDLSVRAAHLDANHAYFNGSSVFLAVEGATHLPCCVEIVAPSSGIGSDWRVATSLSEAGAVRYGFGRYRASDYDELIDHPVEMAAFTLGSFEACGVPHDVAITGRHDADMTRLCADLKRICEYEIGFFGGKAPYDRYVFIIWAVGDGYGGLEHRASTSLICSRDDLPSPHAGDTISEGYKTFLGLCSHEYFHNWNVKRIKPACFQPYDLSRESHTGLLWVFEGVTSYYDDLVLARCGLITPESWLETLGQNVTRLLRNPGRFRQTLQDSSFDAWTRFYKQDENSANAIVSYYLKGSLVAMALDLLLRRISGARFTLDHVMKALWNAWQRDGAGLPEAGFETFVLEHLSAAGYAAARHEVEAFFDSAVRSTQELDLAVLLNEAGVAMHVRAASGAGDKGGKAAEPDRDRVVLGAALAPDVGGARVQSVLNGSAAHAAGVSAGDLIVAIDQVRVDAGSIDKRLARKRPGDTVRVHAFRRDELFDVTLILLPAPQDTCHFIITDPSAVTAWLTHDPA